jgi:hypothetical protein
MSTEPTPADPRVAYLMRRCCIHEMALFDFARLVVAHLPALRQDWSRICDARDGALDQLDRDMPEIAGKDPSR